jgi:trimeric autotransporter adhesin
MKNTIRVVLISVGLLWFVPKGEAVSPAPDGGYPGGNTAEGQNAMLNLTSGAYNTAIGYLSLGFNTTGSFCTAVGAGTLLSNTANENTATGAAALLNNTTGILNTANGAFALLNNTTGGNNTAIGVNALVANTIGNNNTALGVVAARDNTEGNYNTAIGYQALYHNVTGNDNTAIGDNALLSSDGNDNTAMGFSALINNTSFNNTAIGSYALSNATGSNNTAVGVDAGSNISTAQDVIAIGHPGANVNNSCYIGNISGADTAGGEAVFITADGKLGTVNMPSAARFKDEIKPMSTASEAIFAFKPVTFRYKKEFDPKGIPQFGLVAEEVEKVNPDLVKRDREGKLQTVRYEAVNAMLLNEFLKEHRKVEKLEATVADLAAELRQVKVQVQTNSPTLRVAAKDP